MVQAHNLEQSKGPGIDEPRNLPAVLDSHTWIPALANKEPEEIMAEAIKRSKMLMKHCRYTVIGTSKHIHIESWQMLGRFDGMVAGTKDAERVEIQGVEGARATAYVRDLNTGQIITEAIAYCMRDEKKWSKKKKEWHYPWKTAPFSHVISMSQTRAQSKALASVERWIAELAGFSGTPAEEMDGVKNEKPKKKASAKKPTANDIGTMIFEMANSDEMEAKRLLGKFLAKAGRRTEGKITGLKDLDIKDLNAIEPYVKEAYEKGA